MGLRPITAGSAMFVRANRVASSFQCQRSIHSHRNVVIYSTSPDGPRTPRSHIVQYNLRYASSPASRVAAHKPSSITSQKKAVPLPAKPAPSSPQLASTTRLNPPDYTYAPELNVPAREPNQSYPGYLFKAGRSYLSFYKSGISNVRSTAKAAKALRRRPQSTITRAEWQMMGRSRQDMLRLAPFGLLVLIMGEWLPLLALYLTPVIPEPCRIPAQVNREHAKIERRRSERQRKLGIDAARLTARDRKPGSGLSLSPVDISRPRALKPEDLDKLNLFNLLSLSAKFDCHGHFWDSMFLTPPKWLLRRNVGSYLKYLRKDDELLERDGGWQGLSRRETMRACVERGLNVLGKGESDLKKGLQEWFKK